MAAGNNGAEVSMSVTGNAGYVLKGNAANTAYGHLQRNLRDGPDGPAARTLADADVPDRCRHRKMAAASWTTPPDTAVGTPVDYSENWPSRLRAWPFSAKGALADGDTT